MEAAANPVSANVNATVLARIAQEGYGPGAWHGPDLKAALVDVTSEQAFWRAGTERHTIAEIAVHHAYHAHNVRSRLLGETPSPFLLAGDDWFALPSASDLTWPQIQDLVATSQSRLADAIRALGEGRAASPVDPKEQLDLVLGITCHAVYHAGQIQLLKRFKAERA